MNYAIEILQKRAYELQDLITGYEIILSNNPTNQNAIKMLELKREQLMPIIKAINILSK
jgi:hypothetical protein